MNEQEGLAIVLWNPGQFCLARGGGVRFKRSSQMDTRPQRRVGMWNESATSEKINLAGVRAKSLHFDKCPLYHARFAGLAGVNARESASAGVNSRHSRCKFHGTRADYPKISICRRVTLRFCFSNGGKFAREASPLSRKSPLLSLPALRPRNVAKSAWQIHFCIGQ